MTDVSAKSRCRGGEAATAEKTKELVEMINNREEGSYLSSIILGFLKKPKDTAISLEDLPCDVRVAVQVLLGIGELVKVETEWGGTLILFNREYRRQVFMAFIKHCLNGLRSPAPHQSSADRKQL